MVFVFYALFYFILFLFSFILIYSFVLSGSSEGREFKSDFREGEFVCLIISDYFDLSVRRDRRDFLWI